jgi:hypothetical protein
VDLDRAGMFGLDDTISSVPEQASVSQAQAPHLITLTVWIRLPLFLSNPGATMFEKVLNII